jgi:prepilin-type N-terminal cleavage/methylation domain-containing protein/prepilin-type processing-associated H-X9-DG protein
MYGSCRRINRAFTLIELLVVIAIIAILAAILFPVFARAKVAAKKTASVSNLKQISTAAIMYGGDYDDMIPVLMNGSIPQARGLEQPRADTWVWTLQPYIRSLQLVVDPGRGDTQGFFGSGPSASYGVQNFFPLYGMNYLFLSPMNFVDGECAGTANTTRPRFQAKSFTEGSDPARTVFFTESRMFLSDDMRGYYLVNAPGMFVTLSRPTSANCIIWDGKPCSADWCAQGVPKKSTGAVSIFYNDGANVAWLDGHVKYMKDTQLAAGTTYSTAVPNGPDNGGGAVITDWDRYLWNLNDNRQDQLLP